MAPSITSALHPIVINAIQVPPHFTSLGTGLLYGSHPRESPSTLNTLLLSNPSPLTNKSRPKTWWRAQCLLYGLDAPSSRTVQDLRTLLETVLAMRGGLAVPEELVELEHRENGRFRKLNAQVREATGVGAGVKGNGGATSKASVAAKQPVSRSSGRGKKHAPGEYPLKTVKGAIKISKARAMKQPATAKPPPSTKKAISKNPAQSKRETVPKPPMGKISKQADGGPRNPQDLNSDSPADEMDYEMDYEADSSQYREQISRIDEPDTMARWYDEEDRRERERRFYGR